MKNSEVIFQKSVSQEVADIKARQDGVNFVVTDPRYPIRERLPGPSVAEIVEQIQRRNAETTQLALQKTRQELGTIITEQSMRLTEISATPRILPIRREPNEMAAG